MQDILEQVQKWAQLLGPNIYLQAVGIAIAFIVIGKIADLIISRIIARIVSRSKTDLDDNLVALLHRPVFISFVLIGLSLATERVKLPDSPEFLTLGILKTIAIIVWYGFFRSVTQLLLSAIARRPRTRELYASMLPLLQTIFKVTLLALATSHRRHIYIICRRFANL